MFRAKRKKDKVALGEKIKLYNNEQEAVDMKIEEYKLIGEKSLQFS